MPCNERMQNPYFDWGAEPVFHQDVLLGLKLAQFKHSSKGQNFKNAQNYLKNLFKHFKNDQIYLKNLFKNFKNYQIDLKKLFKKL